jgi:hypothetical protein
LKASVISMSPWRAFSSASAACTPSSTSTSPAPSARTTSKATTGLPFRKAPLRRSPTVSLTVATWSRRRWRPSASGMSSAASSAADCTVAMVRTDCSAPPSWARPPAASCCTFFN